MPKNYILPADTETENVEFKTGSTSTLPSDIWQPISAFSNADGGYIIFGVDPNGVITGVDSRNRDVLMRNIITYCSSSFNHKIYPDILTENDIIKVYIPPAPAVLRPIYSTSRGLPNGGRVRIGTSNIQLDTDWIRRFAIAASGGAELVVFPKNYKEYFDQKYIDTYLNVIKQKRGDVYIHYTQEEILIKLRTLSDDKQITMFGLLAFSNEYGLQELTAPTVNIAVTQYVGITKVNPANIAQVSIDDREFSGNLISQFENALKFILSKLPIRSQIESGGKRSEYLAIPEVAIRETLANAIAHRDYTTYNGRIQIDIFANRIEFSNPGRSLIPVNQLENARPETRNPLTMNYLRDLNITEQRGRGIRTIKNSLKAAGLAEPTFENVNDWFVVTIYSSAFINDDDQGWLLQFTSLALNERQLKALVYIKHHPQGINNSAYRDINNMYNVRDDRKANWELMKLVSLKILRKVGENRHRKYILTKFKSG